MTPLYRSPSLRDIETACAEQPLMQRAGTAAAAWAAELATDRNFPVLVLAGPGNNGGDAFEAARLLRERFFDVRLVATAEAERLPDDARAACDRFVAAGGIVLAGIPTVPRWGLIIDGLFGIGLTRPPEGLYAEAIEAANALACRDGCPLLALDCPSGLDADTGNKPGAAIVASHTLTFIAAKPGLYTADGPDHCGTIRIAPLDLEPAAITPANGHLVAKSAFAGRLFPRRRNSNKGTFGGAGILGGAHSMLGAAFLAGRAALKLGAGRVYVGLLEPNAPTIDPVQPELMLRKPEGLLDANLSALACGPGLGASLQANEMLERSLGVPIPLVLDADALNLLSVDAGLQETVSRRSAPTLMTPHPMEAARLLDCEVREVQADRIAAATEIAWRFEAFVALKGCGTVVCTPNGHWRINTTGNPGLASAGTGDVLTGILLALLAQGWPPEDALPAAVHLHGAAADRLAGCNMGPVGLTASEVIDGARSLFNEWLAGTA